jgi:hypothetical protein
MAGTSPAMTAETHCLSIVMPGHSRPKDGVLSHAYVPGIHVLTAATSKDVDGIGSRACPTSAHSKDEPGHDG